MQLDYFDTRTKEIIPNEYIGTLQKLPNGYWQAIVQGVWVVGYGKSKSSAINDAIRNWKTKQEEKNE